MNKNFYQNALAQLTAWFVFDNQGCIIEVNANFCQLTQYTASELKGRHLSGIQLEPLPEQLLAEVTPAADQIWRSDIKIKTKAGDFCWLDATVSAVTDAAHQPVGFICSCLDITAKKLEEIKIAHQIRKNNYMIEHNADGYVCVDADWLVTTCNKKMADILGLSQQESIGRYFLDLFLAGTNAYDKCENLQRALTEQEPASFDVYCPGRKIWFQVNVYPDGEGLALSFRDITEHKLTAEKIKKSEQQLRAILQSTVAAFFFLGLDMRVISFNERARQSIKRMYHKDLQEGDDIRKYSFDPDARVVTDCFGKALEGEPVEIERKTWVNGKTEWYWMTYFPVFDENKQIIGVVLNSANIDNLKFFESETLRMNERFRLAAQATKDAIYDWNIELNNFQRYEAFYEMFGYQKDEVESTIDWWADHIHAEERNTTLNSLNQAILEKQTHWNKEYRFRCRDGSYKFIHDRGYIVYSETDGPARLIGALQDIQQVKENELKIKQQNEQLREIAFSQSHEVRRPVANILGLLQCLHKDDFGPQNQQVLHFLEQTTSELDVLIRKIVDKTYYA